MSAPAYLSDEVSKDGDGRPLTVAYLVNEDGRLLYCLRWNPHAPPRALVFISHGFAEHVEYYKEVAEALVKESYFVFAHDHVGHGRSEGVRAYIDQMGDYVRDVFQHVDLIKSRYNHLPIFIVGHSMGGTIAIKAAMQRPNFFQGVVLVAPGVSLNPESVSPVKVFLAKLLAKIVPHCPISPLALEFITRDVAEIEHMRQDNLRYHGSVKAKFGTAFMDALQEIHNNLGNIEWPFLVLHGSNDKITDISGSRNLHSQASSKDKTLKVYRGAYHNLFHDLYDIRQQTVKDVCGWIGERMDKTVPQSIDK